MASILKVDKLDPQSGTALEIGTSGDTISVPSGATFAVSGTMNASSITAGTLAEARGGTGTTSYTAGITAASQWRLTTTYNHSSATTIIITSNLEEADAPVGFGVLGSSMTESSGIFTFPSTGYWLIEYKMQWDVYSATDRYCGGSILTTTNDATYATAAKNYGSITADVGSGSGNFQVVTASYIMDVTDVSNCKCKFDTIVSATSAGKQVAGNTAFNYTSMTFIRLGDT